MNEKIKERIRKTTNTSINPSKFFESKK